MRTRIIGVAGVLAALATTACGTSRPSAGPAPATATMSVKIALFGGPMRPDGHMGLEGSPALDEPVQIRDAQGRTWPASTGSGGIAVFTVPPGRYRVSSSYCGIPMSVTLGAGTSQTATLQCDVP